MKLASIDSLAGVFESHEIAFLLEIIRSECAEVPGFPYLTKKCYLVEEICETDLFKFKQDDISGASSDIMLHAIKAIRIFEIARIKEVEDATFKETRNHYGEECREYIALTDEQIEARYLHDLVNDQQLERWQQAIDKINSHPHGRDWHTLSVAVHLHNHRADRLQIIGEIRRQALSNRASLSEDVFRNAADLLHTVGLHKSN